MTVVGARKLLGEEYKHLTDEEIELYIKKLRKIAGVLVDAVWDKHSKIESNYEKSNYFS